MDSEIHVREILPSEENSIRELFERNLSIDQEFFHLAFSDALKRALNQQGANLTAMHSEQVVGSVSLRGFVYARKRVGLIDAIITEKSLRGRGIGKSLLDAALSWFKERDYKIVYATVDKHNSSSWRLFTHKGFLLSDFRGQLRDLGLNLIRLWLAEFGQKPNLFIHL